MFSKGFNLDSETPGITWQDLNLGAPTIIAMAHLCAVSMARLDIPECNPETLSREALAILSAARRSGSIFIRGDKNAFEPSERFLAVCVQLDDGRRIEFRRPQDPEQTVRFMDGLRQLVVAGLVMHQLMNDFSLTARGFEIAQSIDQEEVNDLIAMGNDTL